MRIKLKSYKEEVSLAYLKGRKISAFWSIRQMGKWLLSMAGRQVADLVELVSNEN